jgi:hypothetical protein
VPPPSMPAGAATTGRVVAGALPCVAASTVTRPKARLLAPFESVVRDLADQAQRGPVDRLRAWIGDQRRRDELLAGLGRHGAGADGHGEVDVGGDRDLRRGRQPMTGLEWLTLHDVELSFAKSERATIFPPRARLRCERSGQARALRRTRSWVLRAPRRQPPRRRPGPSERNSCGSPHVDDRRRLPAVVAPRDPSGRGADAQVGEHVIGLVGRVLPGHRGHHREALSRSPCCR